MPDPERPDDLVALARAGFALVQGAVLVSPGPDRRALLVTGDPEDVAAACLALVDRGWTLLSDRPTPTRWSAGSVIAHPRGAPFLASGRTVGRHAGEPVRPGSTSLVVEVPRSSEPALVAGIARAVPRRPDEEALAELAGLDRFEQAATLVVGGVLASAGSPTAEEVVDEHARLATIPSVTLRLGRNDNRTTDDAAIDLLLEWWAAR